MIHLSLLITVLVALSPASQAQQPAQPEAIPAPKKVIVQSVEVAPYVPRRDTIEVWQHYGVSPLGRFVPRVIMTEFGPLYSRDLQPYPFIQNRRTAIRP